jgi:putative addiction module component (TIGR02574 family)
MSPTIHDLGIDQLSVEQRLHLMGEIWDSLSAATTPIPESHREELDRRLASADADPNAGASWEVVRERLRDCMLADPAS